MIALLLLCQLIDPYYDEIIVLPPLPRVYSTAPVSLPTDSPHYQDFSAAGGSLGRLRNAQMRSQFQNQYNAQQANMGSLVERRRRHREAKLMLIRGQQNAHRQPDQVTFTSTQPILRGEDLGSLGGIHTISYDRAYTGTNGSSDADDKSRLRSAPDPWETVQVQGVWSDDSLEPVRSLPSESRMLGYVLIASVVAWGLLIWSILR